MSKHTQNKALIAINRALLSGLFRGLGALPWPVLKGISSAIAWLAGDVVKYRRKVCLSNLSSSFPDKSQEEIERIAKDFYRFLADYFVETVKLGSMSADEMRRRMRFENMEEVNEDIRAGRSVSLMLGHYCNWEWVSSLPLWLDPKAVPCQIYHPLSNVAADEVFGRIRSRFGANNLPMATSAKTLLEMAASGRTSVTGYIADQTPRRVAIHHWLPFLNHDTAVFTGAERIARRLNTPVYYIDMRREARGEYVGRFVKISADASAEAPNAVTERYFALLEESIRRQPSLWLWTHRRWKHVRSPKQVNASGTQEKNL